jgi:hypothetical protein
MRFDTLRLARRLRQLGSRRNKHDGRRGWVTFAGFNLVH